MLLFAIIAYLIALMGISLYANRKIHGEEDFLVAGRSLSAPLATATLVATWFGAGTLMTASDEIRRVGLTATALEPLGAGLCLIIAGFFFAKPLWESKLLTLSDFYKKHFGKGVESLSVWITVPGYIGWVAVQLVACASILSIYFGLPLHWGIVVVTAVAAIYTMLGGMWSVTLTDAAQIVLVIIGVVLIGIRAVEVMGNGSLIASLEQIQNTTPKDLQQWIPSNQIAPFVGWLNVLAIAAIGNIPGQDLAQRVFSSRSANTAKWACIAAGTIYIFIGLIPVGLAMASHHLLDPAISHGVIPLLAKLLLPPGWNILFLLALLSVILSTLDSAILAASATLSNNFLKYRFSTSPLKLNQYAVCAVALVSMGVALLGSNAYDLLEKSYAISLVGLFMPLVVGLFFKSPNRQSVYAGMVVGIAVWIFGVFEWIAFAPELLAVGLAFVAYSVHSSWLANPSTNEVLE